MKVRNGFVSNSSSSSFLVNDKSIKSIGECAYFMLNLVAQEYEEREWDLSPEFVKALEWLEENTEYDEPIMFPWSINEETWIWKNDKGICVDTCNNHSWYDVVEYLYAGEDWKWDGRPVGIVDLFSINFFDSKYLDLSTMEKTKVEVFHPWYKGYCK